MSNLAVADAPAGSIFTELSPDIGHLLPLVNYHFNEIKEWRAYQTKKEEGYSHTYHIAEVKTAKDCPCIHIIGDAFEKKYMGYGRWEPSHRATTARQIANDLVRCGSGGEPADSETILPAVWIAAAPDCPRTKAQYARFREIWGTDALRKEFPEFAAEVKRYERREYRYCERQVLQARKLYANEKTRDQAYNEVRFKKAAVWMGLDPAGDPWMDQTTFGKIDKCPFCANILPVGAKFCATCQAVNVKVGKDAFEWVNKNVDPGRYNEVMEIAAA